MLKKGNVFGRQKLGPEDRVGGPLGDGMRSLGFSPDGRFLLIGGDRGFEVRDLGAALDLDEEPGVHLAVRETHLLNAWLVGDGEAVSALTYAALADHSQRKTENIKKRLPSLTLRVWTLDPIARLEERLLRGGLTDAERKTFGLSTSKK